MRWSSAAAATNTICNRSKKALRQSRVVAHARGQGGVAGRHGEVQGRAHVDEVGGRGPQPRRGRVAVVEVQRAAQGQVEHEVPAEGVVPRQPVDQHVVAAHRRPHLREPHLVAGEHPVGALHALGQVGGPRGELDLGQRVRVHRVGARPGLRRQAPVGDQVRQRRDVPRRPAHREPAQVRGLAEGAGVHARVGHEQGGGPGDAQEVLDEVPGRRPHRVGVADRHDRRADLHRRQRREPHLDGVLRQDRQRRVGQPGGDQARRQAVDDALGLAEGDLAPAPAGLALAQERLVRRRRRVVVEPADQVGGDRAQRDGVVHLHPAVGARGHADLRGQGPPGHGHAPARSL